MHKRKKMDISAEEIFLPTTPEELEAMEQGKDWRNIHNQDPEIMEEEKEERE